MRGRAFEEILSDEPQWRGLLCVEEIEPSADQTSMNYAWRLGFV
jgi:hypothetical protein